MSMMDGVAVETLAKTEIPQWKNSSVVPELGNYYRTRAIITRSRFETALDYKPQIFKVRKVSLYYKPLCNINRGL